MACKHANEESTILHEQGRIPNNTRYFNAALRCLLCPLDVQLLAEYSERHEAVLRAPTEQPQKYVVSAMSDGYGGLGNQLPIMVNGFLLALLTNRTFFIDYPLHEQFFTHTLDLDWSNHEARVGSPDPCFA